jgi:type IV secretion system protein VirD4
MKTQLWMWVTALSAFLAFSVLIGGTSGFALWVAFVVVLAVFLGAGWAFKTGAVSLARSMVDREKRKRVLYGGLALSLIAAVTWSVSGAIFIAAMLFCMVGAGMAISSVIERVMPSVDGGGAHGTARFLSPEESASKFKNERGYVVGRNPSTGEVCRIVTERHMLTCAPNRSGKGVGIVLPNLLVHPGSCVVIDIKGENAVVSSRRRRSFGSVVVLDPFQTTGLETGVFNPLRALDPMSENLRDGAASIAEALIPGKPDAELEWWVSGARSLFAGLVMHVVVDPAEPADLGHVRDLLTLRLDETLEKMKESRHLLVQKAAIEFTKRNEKGQNDVLSTAKEHTEFLDSPGIRRVVDGESSFQSTDLKKRVISVFVVLPPSRLGTYDKWLRLIVSSTVLGVTESIAKPKHPVLFLLDEFAQLGYLRPVRSAMGLMAGYGLCLWPVVQDLNQIKSLYGDAWETFISAAESVQYFNISDQFTARYVSQALGNQTLTIRTASQSTGKNTSDARKSESEGESISTGFVGSPLMRPEQLLSEVPDSRMIVTIQGSRPAQLDKVRYYADAEFNGLWDRDTRKDELPEGIPDAWYEQDNIAETDQAPPAAATPAPLSPNKYGGKWRSETVH